MSLNAGEPGFLLSGAEENRLNLVSTEALTDGRFPVHLRLDDPEGTEPLVHWIGDRHMPSDTDKRTAQSSILDCLDDESRRLFEEEIRRLSSSRKSHSETNFTLYSGDHPYCEIQCTIYPMYDAVSKKASSLLIVERLSDGEEFVDPSHSYLCSMQMALRNSGCDYLIVDDEGTTKYVSPGLSTLFQVENNPIVGRNIQAFLGANTVELDTVGSNHDSKSKPFLTSRLVRTATGKEISCNVIPCQFESGLEAQYIILFHQLSGRNSPGKNGLASQGLKRQIEMPQEFQQAFLNDRTRLKSVVQSLAQSRLNAEIASRAKSDFLSNVSHEIRTPLNAILGMADLLAMEDLSPGQMEYIRIQRKSGQTLLGLVNELLDLNKIESGRIEIEHVEFSIVDVLLQLESMFQPVAADKGVALSIEMEAESADIVNGDRTRTLQIFTNLLSNAFKFTETGSVVVRVGTSHEGGRIKLSANVADTGIGMTPDQTPMIFDRFTQADTSTTRLYGGTGLGLALCKQFCHLMDGDIDVESAVNQGSIFSFSILCDAVGSDEDAFRQRPAPKTHQARNSKSTQDLKISVLVAEDNPINQTLVKDILEGRGYRVKLVKNGLEAVEQVTTGKYQIVLMDLRMPVVDGFEALSAIRRLEGEMKHVPVIAVTADAMLGVPEETIAAGFDACVVKPYTKEELPNVINHVLKQSR